MNTEVIEQTVSAPKAKTVVRVILGAAYVVFGLNGFLQFMPNPPVTPEAGAYLGALFATGYMFPFIKITEILGGALLLANRSTIGAVILFPVTLNILAVHLFLNPAGIPVALVFLALNLAVAWFNRENYKSLFIRG